MVPTCSATWCMFSARLMRAGEEVETQPDRNNRTFLLIMASSFISLSVVYRVLLGLFLYGLHMGLQQIWNISSLLCCGLQCVGGTLPAVYFSAAFVTRSAGLLCCWHFFVELHGLLILLSCVYNFGRRPTCHVSLRVSSSRW